MLGCEGRVVCGLRGLTKTMLVCTIFFIKLNFTFTGPSNGGGTPNTLKSLIKLLVQFSRSTSSLVARIGCKVNNVSMLPFIQETERVFRVNEEEGEHVILINTQPVSVLSCPSKF